MHTLLTHKKLGIQKWEYEGLLQLLVDLKTGKFQHVSNPVYVSKTSKRPLFNMEYGGTKFDCGSVACIGGWLYTQSKNLKKKDVTWVDLNNAAEYTGGSRGRSPVLGRLFYPPEDYEYSKIKMSHAAQAILNFLMTGDPMWEKVLPDSCLFAKR
jgi:hypothetical protein